MSRLGLPAPARGATPLGFAVVLAGLLVAVPVSASRALESSAAGAFDGEDPRVEARLLVHPDDRGDRVRVGVHFELDPGWHLYWRNPGESGLPTHLDWRIEAAELGPVRWPAPSVFGESEGLITTWGYADDVLLTREVRLYGLDGVAERVLRVDADFLVCKDECIPGELSLVRDLRGRDRAEDDGAEGGAEAVRTLFARFAARVPEPAASQGVELGAVYSQSALRPGDRFTGAIEVRSCVRGEPCTDFTSNAESAVLFADLLAGAEIRPAGVREHPSDPNAFLLTFSGEAFGAEDAVGERLTGVIALATPSGGIRAVELDVPIPRAPAGVPVDVRGEVWLSDGARSAAESPGGGVDLSLVHALLLALIGGVILNGMPCVLPVLAIKIFSITELAGQSRREVIAHGGAYTAGILLTMGALASAVALLRALGTGVGWGFQFQEPAFAIGISALLVVFALNLFGVFEITAPTAGLSQLGERATPVRRSFFEGLLAVILATPCSAPFLGTAVGFAFAGSVAVIFAIFAAVGLGLALPFLLVSLVPGFARFVPRSGSWMLKLRTVLGFCLLGTVVWLLWILGRSTSVDAVIAAIAFLVALAFAAWVYGALQSAGRPGRAWALSLGVAGVAFGVLNPLSVESVPEARAAAHDDAWRPFDAAEIQATLASGQPVFVDFTADWCITCAANERLVISDERVQAELGRRDVALFKADWTRRDETIRLELARFGKAGVPLYLVYHPDAPDDPQVLPELLTVDLLLAALEELPAGS